MEKGQPIAFMSKALGDKYKHQSICEKEFLALMMAMDTWCQYVQHQEFIIKTYHQSLAFLTDQHLHSDTQKKAMAKLMGLKFKIVYTKGKENLAADALSRVGHLRLIQGTSEVQLVWIQEVLNSYTTDPKAQLLLTQLALQSPNAEGYSLHQGLIRFNDSIWIGQNFALQTKLTAAFHASVIGGHSGTQATYHKLKNLFRWTGMKQDVGNFVRQCEICSATSNSHSCLARYLYGFH
jgi:hypothetical protein